MKIPEFLLIGWWHGWWFTVVFGMVNGFIMLRYPRCFSKRVLRVPPFTTLREKVVSYISVLVFTRGLMILTVFIPIRSETIWFLPGMAVFAAGTALYTNAMIHFAKTDLNRPVVTGIYRFSRHPMQVFSLIMWVGVGMATASPIILVICMVQVLLVRVFMISQERFCLDQYGEGYRAYLQRTPRFFGFTGCKSF